ncbi:unnamed protein product [Bursaphelenchus okinawaensis]|uniref:NDT80 domain-containing protein n=1 Tax=Bursaphelenchus okinawaensis TaxID=465554 RepID=A0A811KGT5_9BILA|nr:unnamed protein product [Bursaphelenchus okinawaensis]CAG9103017.1 unnamed protein product [Bursaphelenchus okinawaensis]
MANNQGANFRDETGFGDPLSNLSNCENFNILQFINDESADGQANVYQQQYQQQQHYAMQQQPLRHVQQPVCLDNNMMAARYPQVVQTKLPDSPPITDISAGASSGSPSSEPPFSPDQQYQQYQFQQNPSQMGQMRLQDPNVAQQQLHQSQVSPNSDYMSYTSHTSPTQLSPQQVNQQTFLPQQQHLGFTMDMYLNDNSNADFNGVFDDTNPRAGQKRKRVDPSVAQVKHEQFVHPSQTPMPMSQMVSSSSSSTHSGSMEDFDEGPRQRTIRFQPFDSGNWSPLFNEHRQQIQHPSVQVIADKGFAYSPKEQCFINQKKNHFQITCHIDVKDRPTYVLHDKQLKPIRRVKLLFYGTKAEMTSYEIEIRQSQADRKPIRYDGDIIELNNNSVTKKTICRLHFSKCTDNNNRKSNKKQLNPDQKYFMLIVKFIAEVDGGAVQMHSFCSDRVIVRASNPAQFAEPEIDAGWKQTSSLLHFNGQVAVGTDAPFADAQLSVMGNLVATGSTTRPSDRRVKEDIVPVDTQEALERINRLRIVQYAYKPELAEKWGLKEADRHRVGVIAQELAEVLPDAVKENGELYTVDETRIFYEGFAAAQELSRLYGHLDGRVDKVQQIADLLAKDARRRKKLGASMASGLSGLTQLVKKEPKKKTLKGSKFVSQSELSINSASPSMDGSASQIGSASQVGYKRYKKRHSKTPELCGSKMTQCTMVALVSIMSLCLVTMCTLYVMDWYNRTYVYTPHSFPRNPPSTPPMLMDNIIDLTNKEWVLPKQPLVHPLLSTCPDSGMHCPKYCCASNSVYNSSNSEDSVDGVLSLDKKKDKMTSVVVGNDGRDVKPFGNGIEIKLKDLDISLDESYCVEGSCAPRKGRYNLYIPISAYMPTMPLQININVPKGMFVSDCGALKGFKHQTCELESSDDEVTPQPRMFKTSLTDFQVTAGDFMQSAYRFRVGHSTMSCQMSEDQQGRSFDEFNLVFYRKCI